jgi:hypothetical protein
METMMNVVFDLRSRWGQLDAAVFEDLNQLCLALVLGIEKLERWAMFRREALADPIREGDADPHTVGDALEEIAGGMERQAKFFDPELPISFRYLAEAVRDPTGATKAIVYGAVKVVQNLMVFLSQRALGFAQKTVDALEEKISKKVASALLIIFGTAALRLSGTLPQDWTWLKTILEIIAKTNPN